MTVSSMTGFARAQDHSGPWRCAWEIKTVNSKGLDLRLRTPPNFDALEVKARALIASRLARGGEHGRRDRDHPPFSKKCHRVGSTRSKLARQL